MSKKVADKLKRINIHDLVTSFYPKSTLIFGAKEYYKCAFTWEQS